jgi:predicted RNase H-like HicB family nuclease
MKYLIVCEKSATGSDAYAPDLPGLGAAGKTLDEVKDLIREAVEFHWEGMRAHGDPIPAPSAMDNWIHHDRRWPRGLREKRMAGRAYQSQSRSALQ